MSMLGKRVETAVFVAGERVPVWQGVVIEEQGDNCKVDIAAGIPGCAPRCHWEATSHLRVVTSDQLTE